MSNNKYIEDLDKHFTSFEKYINNNGKIAIWGASSGGDACYRYLSEKGYSSSIAFFIDKDIKKQGKLLHGIPIKQPDILNENRSIAIVLATIFMEKYSNSVKKEHILIKHFMF